MKRSTIVSVVVAAIAGAMLVACSDVSKTENTYTVRFVQEGYPDIVRTVKDGVVADGVPQPKGKTGYTVTWDTTDFSKLTSDKTVNAVFEPNTYTITYDANGGQLENTTQQVKFAASYTLAVPTHEDPSFAFIGWSYYETEISSGSSWNIADNIVLRAMWGYTVTFRQSGYEDIVKRVPQRGTLTDIPRPQPKKGYSVDWDTSNFTNITDSFVVNAVENPNIYNLEYNVDGGDNVENTTFTYDSAITLAKTTKSGYTFGGWSYGQETWTYNAATDTFNTGSHSVWDIAGNVTLTAIWNTAPYILLFDPDGGLGAPASMPIGYGDPYMLPAPTKTGHHLDGWYVDADKDGTLSETETQKIDNTGTWNVRNGYNLIAKWVRNTYTAKFVDEGGQTVAADLPVTYGLPHGITDPVKTGYSFVKWKLDDADIDLGTNWTINKPDGAEVTLVAVFDGNVSNITFDPDGGAGIAATTAKYGQPFDPDSTTKDGNEFDGWYYDNGEGQETKIIKGDPWAIDKANVVLKAKWNPKWYDIEYLTNGGNIEDSNWQQVQFGSDVVLRTPTRTGYKFRKWVLSSNNSVEVTDGTWMYSRKVTLLALWDPHVYNVSFVAGKPATATTAPDAFTSTVTQVTYDSPFTALGVPVYSTNTYDGTYDFCHFEGWYYQDTRVGSGTSGGTWRIASEKDGDTITLTGRWIETSGYLGTFYVNGEAVKTVVVEEGEAHTLKAIDAPAVEVEGHTWNGVWYSDPQCTTVYEFAAGGNDLTQNTPIYTKTTPITYTVKFDANGGTPITDTASVTYGLSWDFSSIVAQKTGYSFGYWEDHNGHKIDEIGTEWTHTSATTGSNEITLRAIGWEAESYALTYNVDGGDTLDPDTFEYDSAIELETTTKTGYDFGGWTYGSENWTYDQSTQTFNTGTHQKWDIAQPVTLTAIWNAKTYDLTFDTNGGQAVVASTFVYNSDFVTTLPVTTKSGYVFGGWKYNSEEWTFDGTDWDFGSRTKWDIADNVRLVAIWAKERYNVTINYGSCEGVDINSERDKDWFTGALPASQYVENGNEITLTVPKCEGFTFVGWLIGESTTPTTDVTYTVTGNVNIIAVWVKDETSDRWDNWSGNY